ncbi:hypothetical protein BC829DRAFT_405174 [Chytridium lagenaria]|nr:hypothetical protein BC829DRAFT_405174 [Chytridium lagenaria]
MADVAVPIFPASFSGSFTKKPETRATSFTSTTISPILLPSTASPSVPSSSNQPNGFPTAIAIDTSTAVLTTTSSTATTATSIAPTTTPPSPPNTTLIIIISSSIIFLIILIIFIALCIANRRKRNRPASVSAFPISTSGQSRSSNNVFQTPQTTTSPFVPLRPSKPSPPLRTEPVYPENSYTTTIAQTHPHTNLIITLNYHHNLYSTSGLSNHTVIRCSTNDHRSTSPVTYVNVSPAPMLVDYGGLVMAQPGMAVTVVSQGGRTGQYV